MPKHPTATAVETARNASRNPAVLQASSNPSSNLSQRLAFKLSDELRSRFERQILDPETGPPSRKWILSVTPRCPQFWGPDSGPDSGPAVVSTPGALPSHQIKPGSNAVARSTGKGEAPNGPKIGMAACAQRFRLCSGVDSSGAFPAGLACQCARRCPSTRL